MFSIFVSHQFIKVKNRIKGYEKRLSDFINPSQVKTYNLAFPPTDVNW